MKNVFLIALCSWFLTSCNNNSDKPAEQDPATSGTLELLCDETVYDIIQPTLHQFDSAYPNAHVTAVRVSAREAMARLLADSTRGIIVARNYVRDEDSLMKSHGVTRPAPFAFAIDALAFFVKKDFPLDTISAEQVKAVLRDGKAFKDFFPHLTAEPTFVVPGVNSSVYGNILNLVTGNNAPQHPIRFVETQADVREAVLNEEQTIGVGYLSAIAADTAHVRALRIGFADSTGKYIMPRVVHQAYVYLQQYPFPVTIQGIMTEDNRALPWGVFSFLSRNAEVQKYFRDIGIVPAFAKIRLVESE